MKSDAELLQLYARARDAAAFTSLVQRYMPMVYRAAWRQLGAEAHAVEDVAQAVFTLLARKAGGLGDHPNLAGWLHVATRNTVRDHLRSARRRAAREREAMRMTGPTGDAGGEAGIDWDQLRPLLDEALGDLRAADREALLLRYFQGHSFAAVGSALALGEDAARMRVNRALDRLRDQLARRGIKSTATALGVTLAAEPALAVPPAGLAAAVSGTALTQAATAGGIATLAGSLLLMSTTKMVATGALALAAVGWATWEYGQQEQVLRETARAEAMRADAAAAQAMAARAAPVAPALPPEVGRKSTAGAGSGKTLAEREAEAVARANAFMDANPEVRTAWLELRRASVARDAASFYVTRKLTAAQRQAFEEIMLLTGSTGETFGDMAKDEAIVFRLPKLIDDAERDGRIEALLGKEGLAAFKAWQQFQDRERVVRQAASGWWTEGSQPMTAEQAQALRTLFVAAPPRGPGRNATAYWDEIVSRARDVLTPAQVESLVRERLWEELNEMEHAASGLEPTARDGGGS